MEDLIPPFGGERSHHETVTRIVSSGVLSKQGKLIPELRSGDLSFVDEFRRNCPVDLRGNAAKVLVSTENDEASKALGASFPEACGFGFREDGSGFWCGSWSLFRNDEVDGAWVIGSIHPTPDYDFGSSTLFSTYKFSFGANALDDYSNGKLIEAVVRVENPHQDICLYKLKELVYEDDGSLMIPLEFYTGELSA